MLGKMSLNLEGQRHFVVFNNGLRPIWNRALGVLETGSVYLSFLLIAIY